MTLLTPLALVGLLLLPVLVALHLYRSEARTVEVPSLILWEDLVAEPAQGGKRWRLEHLLLLLLQLLAVTALVFALARPAGTGSIPGTHVYVIDDGTLMTAADPAPSRLAAAITLVSRNIQAAPDGSTFTVVAATAKPRVLVSTSDRALALRRVHGLEPLAAAPDFARALTLAANLLPARNAHLLVVYAQGESVPSVRAPRGVVSSIAIGRDTNDQAIATLGVRCLSGATNCNAFADVRNTGSATVQDGLVIEADGVVLGQETLTLPPRSDTDLSFAVPATRHLLQLFLTRRDLVVADNLAWAPIPGPRPTTVSVVGDAAHTAALVRALGALPAVHVVVRTPNQFKTLGGPTDLLILDGWLPSGPLPNTPNLVLIDPPRFPGAPTPGTLGDATISGEDSASPLLAGIDLTSLDVPPGTARQFELPAELRPVVRAPGGPLLAAGSLQGRRIVVLAFEPSTSNLSQLNAFPLLIANILRWSNSWLPAVAAPGDQLAVDVPPSTTSLVVAHRAALNAAPVVTHIAPAAGQAYVDAGVAGIYTVTEQGTWGTRSADIAVNPGAGAAITPGPIVAQAPPAVNADVAPRNTIWWPWLGLLTAALIAAEWLIALLRLER